MASESHIGPVAEALSSLLIADVSSTSATTIRPASVRTISESKDPSEKGATAGEAGTEAVDEEASKTINPENMDPRDVAKQIRLLQKQIAGLEREREQLQSEQNRGVLTNMTLEETCREIREANVRISKMVPVSEDAHLIEKLEESKRDIEKHLSELVERSELLEKERSFQMEAFNDLVKEQEDLDKELSSRDEDFKKREEVLRASIDFHNTPDFKEVEKLTIQCSLEQHRLQMLEKEEENLKIQLSESHTRLEQIHATMGEVTTLSDTLASSVVSCRESLVMLRADLADNQQKHAALKARSELLKETRSGNETQLKQSRAEEDLLKERARMLQKLRSERTRVAALEAQLKLEEAEARAVALAKHAHTANSPAPGPVPEPAPEAQSKGSLPAAGSNS